MASICIKKYILGENAISIYFSDHGGRFYASNKISWHHTFFSIKGKNINNVHIDKMFSYEDFYLVISDLLTYGKLYPEKMNREYIQRLSRRRLLKSRRA